MQFRRLRASRAGRSARAITDALLSVTRSLQITAQAAEMIAEAVEADITAQADIIIAAEAAEMTIKSAPSQPVSRLRIAQAPFTE